jgi:hypothetical protein
MGKRLCYKFNLREEIDEIVSNLDLSVLCPESKAGKKFENMLIAQLQLLNKLLLTSIAYSPTYLYEKINRLIVHGVPYYLCLNLNKLPLL